MSATLTPCPACARHVKQGDCTCPFCGASVPCAGHVTPTAREANGATARRSRTALFAAGAVGVVLSSTACGSAQSLYGGPVPPLDVDAGDARTTPDPGPDAGSKGLTLDDGSTAPDAPARADAAGPMTIPIYGGPPPVEVPRSPGGRSDPVDRPELEPGAVVRPRRPRRRTRR